MAGRPVQMSVRMTEPGSPAIVVGMIVDEGGQHGQQIDATMMQISCAWSESK